MANETAALYATSNALPLVFRSQAAPEIDVSTQGLDIAEGPAREFFRRTFLKRSEVSTKPGPHHSLGLAAYAQVLSLIHI